MNKAIFAVSAFLACTSALAQPPAAPQPTLQAHFDAASSALARRDWAEALRQFETLEARATNARTLAIIRVREASALTALDRLDEAERILRASLPLLPAGDASLDGDRYDGLITLGAIAERRLDYDAALGEYRLAAAIRLPEIDKLSARRGIVQTLLFSDPEAALREADATLAVVAAGAADNHALEGAVQTLKGRALLNLGRHQEAQAALTRAMRLLGGLTTRVDLADIVARSDLALAALLAGAGESAREYLAYTGAGQFSRGYLRLSESAELPHCGGALLPGDVAVIEAAVADDGRVIHTTPIYASRRGGSALAFARAAADWTFEPESVTTIPPLFRIVARFEVRCSQSVHDDGYAEDSGSTAPRLAAIDPAWRAALERLRRLPLSQLRRELQVAEAPGANGQALLPLLVTLGLHQAVPAAERETLLRRAFASAANLPGSAPLLANLALAFADASLTVRRRQHARPEDFEALLALPQIAASPRAATEIRLALARLEYRDNHDERVLVAAAAIRDMPGLAAEDPLRTQALELIIAVRAGRGEVAEARAAHDAMGAQAPRCVYGPRRRRITVTDRDFPNAALRWGFEGWAIGEAMVGSSGMPQGVRTLLAYPAFVFSEAEEGIVGTSRFDPIYTPDGAACPGARQRVQFLLPAG